MAILICVVVLAGSALAGPLSRPDPDEHVRDLAGLLGPRQRAQVQRLGNELLRDHGVPLLVLTLPQLADAAPPTNLSNVPPTAAGLTRHALADWSVQHPLLPGPDWSRGVLLLIADRDRRARIELGPGYAGQHDAAARDITDLRLFPALRRGRPGSAVTSTAAALDATVRQRPLPPLPVSRVAVAAWIGLALLILLSLVSWLRHGRKGHAARAAAGLLSLPATLLDLLQPQATHFMNHPDALVIRRPLQAQPDDANP